MRQTMIAGLTAVSLMLASVAPAQADGLDREDVGRLVLGLLVIGAVGAAIDNNRRDETRNDAIPVQRGSWADLDRPRPRHEERRNERHRMLPARCLQTVDTRFGPLRLFGDSCLERNYRFARDLPARCEVRIFSDRGPRDGYDPLCLREQGYGINRRH